MKCVSLIFIVVGEIFSVYSQVGTAALKPQERSWLRTSPFLLLTWALGGLFLISGYVLGKQAFNGVWAITAISVTSILMVEPMMLLALLAQRPSWAEINGFVCGAIGLVITLLG